MTTPCGTSESESSRNTIPPSSSSMEYCPFPIELCNAIMDALSEHHKFQWSWSFAERSQHALCACALTCCAWRVRAQRLLWHSPCLLVGSPCIASFNTAIRSDTTRSLILSLILKRSNDVFDYKGANDLFMHSFPNLLDLLCDGVHFDVTPQL